MFKVICVECGIEEMVSEFVFKMAGIQKHECDACYMKTACTECMYQYCECY